MALASLAICSRRLTPYSASASSKFVDHKLRHFTTRFLSIVPTKTQSKHRSCKSMASISTSASNNKDVAEVATQLEQVTAPYGSWKSPLTADVVSGSSKRLGGTAIDSHGRLIWLESRPTESGYVYFVFCFCTISSYKPPLKP